MNNLFYDKNFNQDIGYWDVSNVTDMQYMFTISNFSYNVASWDTTNVTNTRPLHNSPNPF